MEVWKAVKDYEGLYEVSNLGRIRSVSRVIRWGRGKGYDKLIEGRILSPSTNNSGYEIIILNKPNHKTICRTIHRLVAEAFIPNPNNLTDVNHKDEDKMNNNVENLEWMTHKDNMNWGETSKKISTTHRSKTDDDLLCARFARGWMPDLFRLKKRCEIIHNGISYSSREEAAERLNKTRSRITQLVREGKAIEKIYYTQELN